METKQLHCCNRQIPNIAEQVYESLLGLLIEDCRLPWVENIFVPGHPCHEEYTNMRQAYDRLLTRLGETDEDPDAEEMINALLEYGKSIALEMFRCGREYQQRLDDTQ